MIVLILAIAFGMALRFVLYLGQGFFREEINVWGLATAIILIVTIHSSMLTSGAFTINYLFEPVSLILLSVIIFIVFINIRCWPMAVICVGIFLNFIAIVTNGLHMPASGEAITFIYKHNPFIDGETMGYWRSIYVADPFFPLLIDRMILYINANSTWIFSIGDVFIVCGIFLMSIFAKITNQPVWKKIIYDRKNHYTL